VGASVTTYTDDNLEDNAVYYYRVRAYYSSYYSTYSNTASATTKDRTGPSSPNLTVTADNANNEVDANWHSFKIASSGYDDSPMDHYIYVDGVLRVTIPRSYAVVRLNSDGSFNEVKTYDVYGNTTQRDQMVSYLNGLPSGTPVLVGTFDEPRNNLDSTLKTALKDCGASDQILNAIPTRGSYILVGEKGLGAGNAYEEKIGLRYGSSIYVNNYYGLYHSNTSSGNYTLVNGKKYEGEDLSWQSQLNVQDVSDNDAENGSI